MSDLTTVPDDELSAELARRAQEKAVASARDLAGQVEALRPVFEGEGRYTIDELAALLRANIDSLATPRMRAQLGLAASTLATLIDSWAAEIAPALTLLATAEAAA